MILEAVEKLRAVIEIANIPTLLLVLAHLTGDRSWLEEPLPAPAATIRAERQRRRWPARGTAAGDPRRGVRAACGTGATGVRSSPRRQRTTRSWTCCRRRSATRCHPSTATALAEEGARSGTATRTGRATGRHGRRRTFRVVVIGAGFSGVCAGASSSRALGIPFTMIEKNNDRVGGTWLENTYPGAGVDTPSHLYSFSFARTRTGRGYFAKPEIHDYLEPLRPRVRGAAAHPVRHRGRLGPCDRRTAPGRSASGRRRRPGRPGDGPDELLVADSSSAPSAQLNRPRVPHIPGLDRFDGPACHSARWRHDVDSPASASRSIGTGASAMQIVPAIAGRRRTPDRVPALAAVGGAVEKLPAARSPETRLPDASSALYRAWYRIRLCGSSATSCSRRCRRTPSGSTPSGRQRDQRRPPDFFTRPHRAPSSGTRTDLRSTSAARLPAVRQADPARQRLVPHSAANDVGCVHRGGRRGRGRTRSLRSGERTRST